MGTRARTRVDCTGQRAVRAPHDQPDHPTAPQSLSPFRHSRVTPTALHTSSRHHARIPLRWPPPTSASIARARIHVESARNQCPSPPSVHRSWIVCRLRRRSLALFHRPVAVPGLDAHASWVMAISASSGLSGHDDDHWVDNVVLVAHPTQPPPPSLINASARTIALAWASPHHGGAPISLYRLQRRATNGWVTVYVGNGTQRIVGPLAEARTHLFRVQAYNSV